MSLPKQAQVVIIGGGVVGCSLAYHLAKMGQSDVVLLERKQLTCGTTWHAAGLIGQLRSSLNMTLLARYTADLYYQLEEETGQPTGIKQNGSVTVATHDGRMEELRRQMSTARTFGLDIQELRAEEAKERWPLLNVDDAVGGIYIPGDGQGNPIDTTTALAKGARMYGAQLLENVKVLNVLTEDDRAVGVETEQGTIMARHVVNCGGLWGWELGRKSGVDIPLHGCEHFYIITEDMADVPSDLPVLRVPDDRTYYKEDTGKLLIGGFEYRSKPWGGADGIPEDFCFDELPEDMEHFMPILEQAMQRVPALQSVGIRKFFNGPESFTPDNRYLLGEAPNLKNYYVSAGFNSTGFQSAGGAGKALAEWIINGHPPMDLWDVDIRRMAAFQANPRYLKTRSTESLGRLYGMHWPHLQAETARNIRKTPLHDRLAAQGACFAESACWERPGWFAPDGVKPEYDYSWGKASWFPHWRDEHLAVRNNVGLFDQSSFAKFMVQGRDAEAVLQTICANNVDVPVGRIVYSQWLNERGGIEADLTVTRLAHDRYLVVTGTAVATRDLTWLKRHIPGDAFVTVTDVTSGEAVLSVMGPNSRALLQTLTDTDLGNEAFPFGTAREIDLAMARVRAHRITYVGELGWELYIPTEFATHVFDAIVEAGKAFDLKLCGTHAIDSLRSEKGYRHWGHDIADEDTPLEAGLGFACKLKTNIPFIGREVLERQKADGLTRRLVQFQLEDTAPMLYHDEPIWRNGEIVGRLTSGSYSHSIGSAIGLGYVSQDGAIIDKAFVDDGTFEIEVAGQRFAARASLSPLYDPKSLRVKS